MVNEVTGVVISVLLISLAMYAGANFFTSFTGTSAGNVPGQTEGQNFTQDIEGYIGSFKQTAETETSIGVTGLMKLIKDVILGAPKYISSLMYSSASYVGIPSIFPSLLRVGIYITLIMVGILLLRGITR